MSFWNSPKSTSSYVTKLDLTLCRPKADLYQSNVSPATSGNQDFGTDYESYAPTSTREKFLDGCCNKSGDSTGIHRSSLDITLEQKDRRENPLKSPVCTCSSTTTRPHMPWRYSSSCSSSQGSQHCLGQGGFVHGHGCGFTNSIPKKKNSVTLESTSSPVDNPTRLESFPTVSKSQSSWTSRLDVVLASNSAVSGTQIGKAQTIFTSSSEQPCKEYAENVPPMPNIQGVKMYISSCSLTVQPLRSKCQGGSLNQPVLLMPEGDNSTKQYSVGFQTPQKRFIVSEAPTLQITQFQLTRSPANTPTIQQTSSRNLWISPEKIPKVSGTPGTPEMVPNVLVFQRSYSPGCKTNLYPVLIPTQHKTSKVSLVIGSPVAPVPVQIIHEFSRSPTPAIFISNGDQPNSSEDLGSGYLLSVNPIAYSKPRHADALRSSPVLGAQPVRCKQAEPYFCHSSPCTVVPRVPNTRDYSAPINVSIETFGHQRGAVKISISHSRCL
ncbi:hypothetical protein GDO81_015202 [Engystomops pustulosus]|uniref:Uncharacterized protein n=1 Tax=Engystomops pustulosus TaxID=76066 RepID=A0AAV7ANA6_ENGPU|nr:hypothetical protein GDO81_015202 [Engystomops pustulosus]